MSAKETKNTTVNPMRQVEIDKVTVNICVGNDKPGMVKAEKLLKILTKKTPVIATAKRRLATWQIRPGLPIGYKVTLRENDAKEFLKWTLASKANKIKAESLDTYGNFAVGIHEYLELSGMKYDSEIGIMGFEFMVTFTRPGFRIKSRRLKTSRVPLRHKVTKDEVINYLKENLKVSVE
jgi:large subunit ribosomal protein L5